MKRVKKNGKSDDAVGTMCERIMFTKTKTGEAIMDDEWLRSKMIAFEDGTLAAYEIELLHSLVSDYVEDVGSIEGYLAVRLLALESAIDAADGWPPEDGNTLRESFAALKKAIAEMTTFPYETQRGVAQSITDLERALGRGHWHRSGRRRS